MASVDPDHPRSPIARLERVVRRAITRGVQHDAERLRAAGARVVVLTPGPYDLDVMGANLMNPRRRTEVLETSLLSSAATLRALRLGEDLSVPVPADPPRSARYRARRPPSLDLMIADRRSAMSRADGAGTTTEAGCR